MLFIKSLKYLQNHCLYRVIKIYKRTFTAALKQKLNVMSVNLYIEYKAIKESLKTTSYLITTKIS